MNVADTSRAAEGGVIPESGGEAVTSPPVWEWAVLAFQQIWH